MLASLPAEDRAYVEKAGYKDFGAVLKSERHAQSLLGKPAGSLLQVPAQSRADNPGAWAEFDKALGVPADGKYAAWAPQNGQLNAAPEHLQRFDAAMAKSGATQAQRNAALEAFHAINAEAVGKMQADEAAELAKATTALQRHWGIHYPVKLAAAQGAFKGVDGADDFSAVMQQFGLDQHPAYVRVAAAIAEMRAEGGAPAQGQKQAAPGGAMTKQEAEAKAAELLADKEFRARYLERGDDAAIRQMLELNTIIARG